MVLANRWTLDEAIDKPEALFAAAKDESPQLVTVEGGVYTLQFEDLEKRGSAAEFLSMPGPDKNET